MVKPKSRKIVDKSPPKTWVMPPVVLLIAVVAMVGLWWIDPTASAFPSPFWPVGAALIAIGFAIVIGCAITFGRRETTIRPFEQSSTLITAGIYARTRNPIYLAMVIALLGVWLVLDGVLGLAVIPVFMWWITRRFIRVEERMLEETFGQAYRDYKKRVRQWL